MGSQNHLDLDALNSLIREVTSYLDTLAENFSMLQDAGSACDQAMGSGHIVSHYLNQYNQGLEELNRTRQLAAQVRNTLQDEWKRAMVIRDEL